MAEFPAPTEGIVLTHFIVASDVDRTRRFYAGVLGGTPDDGRIGGASLPPRSTDTGVRCGQGTSRSGRPGSKRH